MNSALNRYASFVACCCLVTVLSFWTADSGLKASDFLNRAFSGAAIGFLFAVPICLLDWVLRTGLRVSGFELTARVSRALFVLFIVASAYACWFVLWSCNNGWWCFGM